MPREKIKVEQLSSPQARGNYTLVQFKSGDKVFFTLSPTLQEHIKKDAELDLEHDEKSKDGYRITNIYIDGQPVMKGGYGKGGGQRYGGKSPQEIHSIEEQVRVKAIVELWVGEKIKEDDSLVTKLRTWLSKLGSPAPKQQAEEKPAKKEVEKPKEEPRAEPERIDLEEAERIGKEKLKEPVQEEPPADDLSEESKKFGEVEEVIQITPEWVRDNLKLLYEKAPQTWSVSNIVSFLNSLQEELPQPEKGKISVTDMVFAMTEENRAKFIKKMEENLEMVKGG